MGDDRNHRWKHLSPAQRTAYQWGLLAALLGVGLLVAPGLETWHSPGPANVGHQDLQCDACHQGAEDAPDLEDLEFVYAAVADRQCLDCHENPEDRHPVERFLEPEFEPVRAAFGKPTCIACHRQHQGVRATVDPGACRHCHAETVVEEDPVDVPHSELIANARWETCLGCHDFHGNHGEWRVPERLSEALSPEAVQAYLDGGDSPYGYRTLTVIDTMKTGEE